MSIRPAATLIGALIATAVMTLATPSFALDEEGIKALLKKNDCFKCHAIDKTKKGPSYKKIAATEKEKAKGNMAEAEQKLIKHMTSGAKVKLEDGTEEEHKIIDSKDPAVLKAVAQWVLSQ